MPWPSLQSCVPRASRPWVPSFPDISTVGSYGQPRVAADPRPEAMATMYLSVLLLCYLLQLLHTGQCLPCLGVRYQRCPVGLSLARCYWMGPQVLQGVRASPSSQPYGLPQGTMGSCLEDVTGPSSLLADVVLSTSQTTSVSQA